MYSYSVLFVLVFGIIRMIWVFVFVFVQKWHTEWYSYSAKSLNPNSIRVHIRSQNTIRSPLIEYHYLDGLEEMLLNLVIPHTISLDACFPSPLWLSLIVVGASTFLGPHLWFLPLHNLCHSVVVEVLALTGFHLWPISWITSHQPKYTFGRDWETSEPL